jgi:predicted tellurium resistance membrane protein TerC
MPLLMVTGGFISMLIDKARWIIYVGAVAISFTAARMVFEDGAMEARFHFSKTLVYAASAAAGLAIPGACVLIERLRLRKGRKP